MRTLIEVGITTILGTIISLLLLALCVGLGLVLPLTESSGNLIYGILIAIAIFLFARWVPELRMSLAVGLFVGFSLPATSLRVPSSALSAMLGALIGLLLFSLVSKLQKYTITVSTW